MMTMVTDAIPPSPVLPSSAPPISPASAPLPVGVTQLGPTGTGWPNGRAGLAQDRRRLQLARDCLIDCEDALLHVVDHDPSLQPLIDQVVRLLMDVSHRADRAPSIVSADTGLEPA